VQGLTRTCSVCSDDDETQSYPVEAMFDVETSSESSLTVADLTTSWRSVTWQDIGRRPELTISMSFGKTFQLQDDLVIVFDSARPQQMVLEKSVDFGETWRPLQYFDRSCWYDRRSSVARTSVFP